MNCEIAVFFWNTQSCILFKVIMGTLCLRSLDFLYRFIRHPIDSQAKGSSNNAQPWQKLPTFLPRTYGVYLFSFKPNTEMLSRGDVKP